MDASPDGQGGKPPLCSPPTIVRREELCTMASAVITLSGDIAASRATLTLLPAPAALGAVAEVLGRAEHPPGDLVDLADALHLEGRHDLAGAVLDIAFHHEAGGLVALIRHVEQAFRRAEWLEVARRSALVRDRFPGLAYGLVHLGVARREAGDLVTADAILAEAVARFPQDEAAHIHFTDLARRRQDWSALEQRSRAFCAAFPNSGFGAGMLQTALRRLGGDTEADALLETALQAGMDMREMLGVWIDSALQRKAWPEVAARCAMARDRHPDFYPAYVEAAIALREAGDLGEADRLFQLTATRFPHEMRDKELWVDLAIRRADLAEADRRAVIFAELFDDNPHACLVRARVLRTAGRLEEAETYLGTVVARFPDNGAALYHWADAAIHSRNWDEALRRGELLKSRLPADAAGTFIIATALREMNKVQEAIDLLAPLADRPGANAGFLWFMADGLIRLHRLAEAATYLDRAILDQPDHVGFLKRRIELAMSLGDEPGAMQAWRAAQSRADFDPSSLLTLAWAIFEQVSSPDAAEELLAALCREQDSLTRSWLPHVAKIERLIHARPELAIIARSFVDRADLAELNATTLMLLNCALNDERSDAAILSQFTNFARTGRAGIIAHLFSQTYCRQGAGRQERIAACLDRWLEEQLIDTSWITKDNTAALLVCLSLAAVFSADGYRRLVAAGRARLGGDAMPDAPFLTTPASCVANILACAGRPQGAPAPAARRLRIAVCVSGQLRGFREAHQTWHALGLAAHDTEFFVHSWFDIGRNWTRFWSFAQRDPILWERLVLKDCLTLLQPRFPRTTGVLRASGLVTEEEVRALYGTEHVRLENDRVPPLSETSTPWKMHNKIERAFDLAMETGQAFDLIIRIRPDRAVLLESAPDWHEVHQRSCAERVIFSDIPLHFGDGRLTLGDQFAAGCQEVMTTYSTIFSETMKFARSGAIPLDLHGHLDNHRSMAYAMFYHGIATNAVPQLALGGLLDPVSLAPRDIYPLVREDIAARSADLFDQRMIEAFETLMRS